MNSGDLIRHVLPGPGPHFTHDAIWNLIFELHNPPTRMDKDEHRARCKYPLRLSGSQKAVTGLRDPIDTRKQDDWNLKSRVLGYHN